MRIYNGLAIPAAGTYDLDPAHTFVMFKAQHLIVRQVGCADG